jgi:hypothetical protein
MIYQCVKFELEIPYIRTAQKKSHKILKSARLTECQILLFLHSYEYEYFNVKICIIVDHYIVYM